MKLIDKVRREIRRRNYSYSTEKHYCRWIIRFIRFHQLTHPKNLKEKDIVKFLNYLAVSRNVAASTQNQALCAIVFLYKEVLKSPVGDLDSLKRAKNVVKMYLLLC